MPKVLVLFYSRTGDTASIVDAIAEGAETVKFTEVEVRRIESLAPDGAVASDASSASSRAAMAKRYRTLESVEALADHDAVIIGDDLSGGTMSPELVRVFDRAESLRTRGALVDKVGSAFAVVSTAGGGGEPKVAPILLRLLHVGMIIVPPAYEGGADAARRQGARVAKVAEWVRHAKSHEAHGHKH